jgi:hypothetical protein
MPRNANTTGSPPPGKAGSKSPAPFKSAQSKGPVKGGAPKPAASRFGATKPGGRGTSRGR